MPRFCLIPIIATLLFWGCGSDSVAQGGSGSDAGNVLTVFARTQNGSIQTGASVEVWPSTQVPDSLGTAASYRATTDSSGRANLQLPPGTWSVLVRKDGYGSWKIRSVRDSLVDTLLPLARLSGQLRGAEGKRVALEGLGVSANCDSLGRFAFARLPAGTLNLVAVLPQKSQHTQIPIRPGSSISFSAALDSLPTVIDTATKEPSGLRSALQDTGAWTFEIELARKNSVEPGRIFWWSNGADSTGIEVWWAGRDSLYARLDGVVHGYQTIPTDTVMWHIGVAYFTGQVQIYMQGDLVGTAPCLSAVDRTTWMDPVVAASGIRTVLGYSAGRGVVDSTYFKKFLSKPETTSYVIPFMDSLGPSRVVAQNGYLGYNRHG